MYRYATRTSQQMTVLCQTPDSPEPAPRTRTSCGSRTSPSPGSRRARCTCRRSSTATTACPSPERACYRCERPFRQRSPTKRHRPLAIRDTPSYGKCREGSESGPSRHFGIWLVEVSQSQPQTDWKRRWSVNFHTVSCSRRSSESRLTVLHCVAYASIQISNASARFASSLC